MDTIILMTILYTILSCPSFHPCHVCSILEHFAILCVFLFLLNAWTFVVEFVLVFMSWGKDCVHVQVYRTITLFSFSFLSFVSEKKKKKKKLYLAFISTHACPLLSFILFLKSLLKKPGSKFSNCLIFETQNVQTFLNGFFMVFKGKMSFFCKFSQQKKKREKICGFLAILTIHLILILVEVHHNRFL